MSVSGFACLCIFPPFVRGGNKASNKQVRESDSLSDAEDSSITRTVGTQRFLIKVAIALIQKGQMTLKKKRQRSFLKASPSANEKSGLSRAKRGGESPGLQGEARRLGKPLFVYLPLSKPRQAPLGRFGGQTRRKP